MKKIIFITTIALVLSSAAWSQDTSYIVGEKAYYVVKYGIITGGTSSLELTNDTLNGKEVWHSKFVAKTTGLADALFKVLDVYESFIDPETELPVMSIRNIREGRYRKYNEVTYDHTSRADSAVISSLLTGIHTTPHGIHDILSCFYYFRNHLLPADSILKEGEITTIVTWFTDELYPIKLKYIGTDVVRTKVGKIRCYKFNPVTEVGRLFKTEEDVSFWFSADKNFLPVKVRFDIFVGAFTVEVVSYEGLLYSLDTIKR